MTQTYTAVIQQDEGWWIGWIQEIPGVNGQERTKDKLLEALRITLLEMIEYNRKEAIKAAKVDHEEIIIQMSRHPLPKGRGNLCFVAVCVS